MNGLEAAMIVFIALLISWLGGVGVGQQDHPLGWGIFIIEGLIFLFLLSMWFGTFLGIVSFG